MSVASAERILQAPPKHFGASIEPGLKIDINAPINTPGAVKPPVSPDIPPRPPETSKRKEIVSSNVADHELRHALIARHFRLNLATVSVKPDGPSLGRVVLAGPVIDPTVFQVFAAASSAQGSDKSYSAEGTGHDHYQIEAAWYAGGEHSVESATAAADSILGHYNPEVLKRAAAILDRQGEVFGGIDAIMEQAYIEMMRDREMHEQAERFQEIHNMRQIERANRPQLEEITEYTMIETLTEDRIRVTVVSGLEKSEQTKCNRCGSLGGGHAEFCRHFKKAEPEPLISSENVTEQKPIETGKPVIREPEVVGRRIHHEKRAHGQRSEARHPVNKKDEEPSGRKRLYDRRTTPMRPRGMR